MKSDVKKEIKKKFRMKIDISLVCEACVSSQW